MLNVAFITLLERKILGYRQYRLGPNKVRIIGILQPISDAIKLFTKQQDSPFSRNYILFFFSPVLRLILILIIWSILPLITRYHNFIFSIIFYAFCLSVCRACDLLYSVFNVCKNEASLFIF